LRRQSIRPELRRAPGGPLAIWLLASLFGVSAASDNHVSAHASDRTDHSPVQATSDTTWVDHDGRPIPQPPEWEPNFWGHQFREGLIEPLSHAFDVPDLILGVTDFLGADPERESVNVNAFDEVPNSTWFTNRNHVRAVPLADIKQGPGKPQLPTKPWTITKVKQGGRTHGFQIKDADGGRWLIKLDPAGHPQLGAGADFISRTLFHAAGYNVPHNEPVQFLRNDLSIDDDLLNGKKGAPFTEGDLDSLLTHGAVLSDGRFSGFASLFLDGKVVGAPSMRRLRPGDPNDRYTHVNRRELRGLYVVCAWLNSWDMKDQNFLDLFVETGDSLGHVDHYVLDVGASLGAAAKGPKKPWNGFEHTLDFKWTIRRLLSLGFVEEPWRQAKQDSGIPSAGNFESKRYNPGDFRTLIPQAAFREMTDRDAYWGAKIVASFSDAQIAAAVGAVSYEDPRARDFLARTLIERRDKTVTYWFDRVAPLDFFSVREGALHFHDLAVDIGLAAPRKYDVEIKQADGPATATRRVQIDGAMLRLDDADDNGATRLAVEVKVDGNSAKAARVELTRIGSTWTVTRVRHG